MDIRPHRRTILSLDSFDLLGAVDAASDLFEHVGGFKIGPRLFEEGGPSLISMARDMGSKILLDLGLTGPAPSVAAVVRSAFGAHYVTVDASSGHRALRAATLSAPDGSVVLASVFSSQVPPEAADLVSTGVLGFLCPPDQVRPLRAMFGPGAVIIACSLDGGVLDPVSAVKDGASHFVVRDAILGEKDRVKAARKIGEEVRPHT